MLYSRISLFLRGLSSRSNPTSPDFVYIQGLHFPDLIRMRFVPRFILLAASAYLPN